MTEPVTEHRTLYLKGFDMMLSMLIAAGVTLYSLYVILAHMDVLSVVIYVIPLLALPLFLIHVFKNKVRFAQTYVEVVTLFGTKRIELKDVKLWGVYRTGWSVVKLVDGRDLENFKASSLLSYNIFLITTAEFSLKALRQKSSVTIPFRKEFYEKVKALFKG